MSFAESVWSFGFLGLLLATALLFRRFRRRTADYHESRVAKGRLPSWVRVVERLVMYAAILGLGALVLVVFGNESRAEGGAHHLGGAAAIYIALGALLIAIPLGALLANLVSWLLPPLRRANEAAMSGTQVSFLSANRGLVLFGAVSVPIGLVAVVVAAIAPWAR
jgi:hypothetical protein